MNTGFQGWNLLVLSHNSCQNLSWAHKKKTLHLICQTVLCRNPVKEWSLLKAINSSESLDFYQCPFDLKGKCCYGRQILFLLANCWNVILQGICITLNGLGTSSNVPWTAEKTVSNATKHENRMAIKQLLPILTKGNSKMRLGKTSALKKRFLAASHWNHEGVAIRHLDGSRLCVQNPFGSFVTFFIRPKVCK